ncbi:MAG: SUMF1/EgtB/PvdO family nonheme iron enzyme, partial [Verrucomicrobia bacterium]|nr:SUMF1/EgtB/PvdO family nonheme iron enzyme [Verrucomicrobiota bacterium]
MKQIHLAGLAMLCCSCGSFVADCHGQTEIPSWAKVSNEQIAAAKNLGIPVAFANSIGMKFVLVPAGSFMMGSPPEEEGRYKGEEPYHKVTFAKPFYISICQT